MPYLRVVYPKPHYWPNIKGFLYSIYLTPPCLHRLTVIFRIFSQEAEYSTQSTRCWWSTFYVSLIHNRGVTKQMLSKAPSHSELLPLAVAPKDPEQERLKPTSTPLRLQLTFSLVFNQLSQGRDDFVYVDLHFIGSLTSKIAQDYIRQCLSLSSGPILSKGKCSPGVTCSVIPAEFSGIREEHMGTFKKAPSFKVGHVVFHWQYMKGKQSLNNWLHLFSAPEQDFSNFNVHMTKGSSWNSCSDAVGPGWGLRTCLSTKSCTMLMLLVWGPTLSGKSLICQGFSYVIPFNP